MAEGDSLVALPGDCPAEPGDSAPEDAGIRIITRLPSAWAVLADESRFRGLHYDVASPDRPGWGVAEIRLNGRPIGGSLVPGDLEGERHSVEVRLGAS